MTATLSSLRDRVEQNLADSGNDIWDRTWLDEAIRQALSEYSAVRPLQSKTTVTVSSATRELDISAVSGVLDVVRVWYPYTAADPEHPPTWRRVEHWRDSEILYFPDGDELEATKVVRLFYTQLQTLNGLDGDSSTTFPAEDENLLVNGAAGHCAASRAIDLTEQVTLDKLTAQRVRAWGLGKLQEFRAALSAVARREALRGSAFVEMPYLDRFDRDGGGWA